MNTAQEVIIVDEPYEHDNAYVIECPKANIRALTSDHDLAQHISDYLSKQHGIVHSYEYCDVELTYFIAAKDTSFSHKVEELVNELQSGRT